MVSNSSPRPGAASSRRWAVCALVATLAIACGAVAFWRRSQPLPPVEVTAAADEEDDEPPARDPGYVGPQACAACHERRVAEFQTTPHLHACRRPQDGPMPPGFAPGRGIHVPHDPGLRFEMTQAGGEFFQTTIRTTPTGEQRSSARIDLVYGANKADEVFFSWRDDDRMYELPVVWLHPFDRWGNATLDRFGTADFSRTTTTRCLECHTTWLQHVPGTANQYRRDHAVLGVTCERCHGPGREHVAFHQAHPDAESAHAVVDPSRLTRERQLEVCTQCHSNANKPRGPAFRYRPGEALEDYFRTARTTNPEDDHVANQVKYLRQSKCFQKSELTCTTCHNPHRFEASAHSGERACLKCHQPAACGERPRLPAAVRDQCVACHMPARVWMNVHFHTADDQYVPPIRRYEHRIGVHATARDEVLLAWHRTQSDAASRHEVARLTQALVAHWLGEAEKYRRAYRFLAAVGAVREALRVEDTPATRARLREVVALQAQVDADLVVALHQMEARRYPEAVATFEKVLAVKPNHALAHGKLGTLYALTGQSDKAAEHWQAVARSDPDNQYGEAMLGWTAYLQGRAEEAVAAYRRADEIEPFDAKTNFHLGLALVRLGRLAEAGDCFRRVLTIDPGHAGGCQGLSQVLGQQGKPAEALHYARRAARLSRFENPDILVTLTEAYASAGRFAEAEATAARALEAAQKGDPQRVPQVRWRLEKARGRGGVSPKGPDR
jgi:tetratricopeptide (TPR) repeat protein